MTVAELIEKLKEMPQDADIIVYDGIRDNDIRTVYKSDDSVVIDIE